MPKSIAETTLIYFEATLAMKEKALAKTSFEHASVIGWCS
jgi:hypothetical protein